MHRPDQGPGDEQDQRVQDQEGRPLPPERDPRDEHEKRRVQEEMRAEAHTIDRDVVNLQVAIDAVLWFVQVVGKCDSHLVRRNR